MNSMRTLLGLLLTAALLAGCGVRPIRPDDPLADRLDARRYLGTPISCVEHGFQSVFGPDPVLPAGTQIRVVEILRQKDLYHVRFTGPAECAPHCTHRIQEGGGTASSSFDLLFVRRDPLQGLNQDERAHVVGHEIAAGMSGALVRLALGEPDLVEATTYLGSPAERWLYQQRRFNEQGELTTRPRLALTFAADMLMGFEEL